MSQDTAPPVVGQMDWLALCRLEPRLAALERVVSAIPRKYRTWRRWESVKATFNRLVGWYAQRPELATCEAYDVAYRTLFAEFSRRGGVQ